MRIGLAIYNFDPKKGGAERYTYDLASILSRKGHEVYIFCAAGVESPGVTLVRLNTIRYPRWLRSLSFALSHKKVVRSKKFGLDVVVGFGNTLEFDVYQSHGGVQKVWMEREIASYDDPRERAVKAFLLKRSMNQKIQQWIAESPIRNGGYTRIVAISDMVRGHMAGYFRIDRDNIDIVYNGVDTERFRPAASRPNGPLKILFSAGNFRLKGLLPLLFAAGDLSRKGIGYHLSVMGRGRRERYERVIDELKIRDKVTFLGETASPEIVYREADVLAHPTFYDACSLTTMEAMASGVPVITTRWNGASALVSPEEGYVIDEPYDVSRLSTALGELADTERAMRMGRNARLKVEQYTIRRNADLMEKIFFEVCDGKHRN